MVKIVSSSLKVLLNSVSIVTKEIKKSYSPGLRTDDDNREWWKSAEAKIQKLSFGQTI